MKRLGAWLYRFFRPRGWTAERHQFFAPMNGMQMLERGIRVEAASDRDVVEGLLEVSR